jgi:hypothetical protein
VVTRALAYVAVEELGDRPHVLVDGATRPGSILTPSHWPRSPTPTALGADGIGSLVTRMRPGSNGKTDLDPVMISRTVVGYVKNAPPAWDPFRRGGALIRAAERRRPQ